MGSFLANSERRDAVVESLPNGFRRRITERIDGGQLFSTEYVKSWPLEFLITL